MVRVKLGHRGEGKTCFSPVLGAQVGLMEEGYEALGSGGGDWGWGNLGVRLS